VQVRFHRVGAEEELAEGLAVDVNHDPVGSLRHLDLCRQWERQRRQQDNA
jgi:hypothetical protein